MMALWGVLFAMSKKGTEPSPVRKWAMRQYWRMQQSQAVVGLLLWGTTITLLLWPYVEWRFSDSCDSGICFNNTILGIPATYIGLVSIFLSVMLGVLTIGYLYDKVFSLWTEWRSVDMERNPYTTYALTPNWMMVTALQAELLKRSSPDDKEIQEQSEWFLKWCKQYAQGELFARAVQRWDEDMGPTPTFWFTDDEAMQKARDIVFDDED
tara:strand:- start:805 stop:1434 length:630 start_codon:yes stop_codon:yes gene_type:complete